MTGSDLPAVSRLVRASPEEVCRVLEDGFTYGAWVVGSARIRAVSVDWPKAGSRLHHSVGTWPVLLSDETVSVEYEPNRRLLLQAKGRPIGQAVIEILIEPAPEGCFVTIREDALSQRITALVPAPIRHQLVRWRNEETLRRLALLAERATDDDAAATDRSRP
jgi:hypothetical protein